MISGPGRMRRAGVVACTLAVAAVGTLAAAATSIGNRASATTPAFTITGSAQRLYPGRTLPLHLTVTNHETFAIVVTSITTAAADASSACPATELAVGAFAGALTEPCRRTAKVTVPIALVHAAPDACQGALFHLTYFGRARKA
jgi:hypothetical protein